LPIETKTLSSSRGNRLRIAGFAIMLIAAVSQALQVGSYWWSESSDAWPPVYLEFAVLALIGWCVAGIGLMLARYLTPYISLILPGGVAAASIWGVVKYSGEQGITYWPPGLVTRASMFLLAGMLVFLVMYYLAPMAGAWLAGYGMRRRRQSRMLRGNADLFD
jgi:hypothetical protein